MSADTTTASPGSWAPDMERIAPALEWLDDSATIGKVPDADLVWSWRHMPRQRALAAWLELAEWVEWWRNRYSMSEIRGCWYRHPPVVEHLWSLMAAHRTAYKPGAKPEDYRDDLIAWHTQWMWPCVRAIKDAEYLSGCTPAECRAQLDHHVPELMDGIEEVIVADLADRDDAPPEDEPDLSQPTMTVDDMVRAVRVGRAEPADADRPDDVVRYEDALWDFDRAENLYRRRPDSGN
ncbi:hypothetical protein [Nocardia farcinica]|uniref:hypothetical protein n=1 Tax=Nocardia farcinica TaxID=37329 RepID=UPI0024576B27|nr:hypothetical protein [Nocardia farcinica]